MVLRVERAVLLNEVQQIGHLLQVRRHVRIVACKMYIVELDVDDVFDSVAKVTPGRACRRRDRGQEHRAE